MTNSEAPGVQQAHFINVLKNVQEVCAVLVVLEDRFLLIAAGGDKVDSDSVFKTKGVRPGARMAGRRGHVKPQDLKKLPADSQPSNT